ncbi:MAG: DegV family protein [Clostridia bacterium]|nr:DegV family protein [Clostridia bacterium]
MIKIMVDSASDCRNDKIYDYFVPITVTIDGKEYKDGVDLDNDTFYQLLTSMKEIPHTSQPSPDDFLQQFQKIKADGDELIYFALSSALSGTYQSANIAKTMVEYEGIYIVDSKNASHMIESLAKYAKKLIAEGLSAKEIVEKCEELKCRIRLFAGVDTLEYLQKGGRIGKATALIGSLANIKPLITVSVDGEVDAVGKALGFARAVQMIVDKVKKYNIDEEFPICSLYTYGEENCIKLEQKLKSEGYCVSERMQVGSTIGTHVGPGVYGVFFVEKQQ